MAGNIQNASTNSPFKIKSKALCVPQPKQSNPKIDLFKQGNIKSSVVIFLIVKQFYKKNIIFKRNNPLKLLILSNYFKK